MTAELCLRARVIAVATAVAMLLPLAAVAQPPSATFKVAFYNIKSGKGQVPLSGHTIRFADTSNCTDPTLPLNAWGVGLVQQHLVSSLGNDPKVVALGLAEAWGCGSPENVRKALGWKSRTSEHNGVGLTARYGFAGPEEWEQLDTTLNTNPADTKWVLRIRVCLDVACSNNVNVFVAHWLGTGDSGLITYDTQSAETVAFMARTAGGSPHMLVGDLNLWAAPGRVCRQNPTTAGLQRLRDSGYMDAWPLLHGSANGFTGMTNRAGCGTPEGNVWKRADYTWSPSNFLPVSAGIFGNVPAGDAAPSDHYGIVSEFVVPGAVVPVDVLAPVVTLLTPADGFTVQGGTVSISVLATDDLGVTRVEILEDGVVAHTLVAGQTVVPCTTLAKIAGTHTVMARAFDEAGNMGQSETHHVVVDTPSPGSIAGEIVLYARNAPVIAGNWQLVADSASAGGARLWSPDASAAKLTSALAAPANYFELVFDAEAGRPYRLWVRGRADRDSWSNDSVYAQFSGSVDAAGTPTMRIGTTAATWVSIEDCSGCGVLGWGWQDNGYGTGVLGPLVYFASSGPQRIRFQQREDGISIDQVLLSSSLYLTNAPGLTKQDTLILPQTVPSTPPDRSEILLTSGAVTTLAGAWRATVDSSASGGASIGTADAGAAKILAAVAAPSDYVDLTFDVDAGRVYHLWMRGRAASDTWTNDSVYVQFSGSVDLSNGAIARVGTTSAYTVNLEDAAGAGVAGWGWQDDGYGAGVLGSAISFAASGPQTIRIQTREDGFRFDQIVLSSAQFLTTAPGSLKNDRTILPPRVP
jgi:hypothetical protein